MAVVATVASKFEKNRYVLKILIYINIATRNLPLGMSHYDLHYTTMLTGDFLQWKTSSVEQTFPVI